MQTYAFKDESVELLRMLLAMHRDELQFILRKSFSPEVTGVYGRIPDESDMQISHELQITMELIRIVDGGAVMSGV